MTIQMPAVKGAVPTADWPEILAPLGRWSGLVLAGSSAEIVHREAPHGGVAFLATPYTGEVQLKRVWRPQRSALMSALAAREMLRLYLAGVSAVCPVLQLAEMCHASGLVDGAALDPLDDAAWAEWSRPLLEAAALIVVPNLQGWSRCPLILRQVQWALGRGLPVHVYARGYVA
jgi:hypothetical protein